MIMPYEKSKADSFVFLQSKPLPEFSSFVENLRFSQMVQEKISDLSKNLKSVQKEKSLSPTIQERLLEIEDQMAELISIRNAHFTKQNS